MKKQNIKTISFNFSLLHVSLSKLHSNVPESLFNSSIHFISVFFFKIPNILPHLQFNFFFNVQVWWWWSYECEEKYESGEDERGMSFNGIDDEVGNECDEREDKEFFF